MPVQEFIGSSLASHILGVSATTVRQWARRGDLPVAAHVSPVGLAFRRTDVERLARERAARRARQAARDS
jgi:predicted site-specific integrase-resolvase